jgi:hypothetical protein
MAPAVRSCLADSTHSTDRETRSTSAFGLLDSKAPMRIFSAFSRRFNLLGRLTLTAAVGAAAAVSLYLVSGSVKTVEDIDRTDDTLAELSQYIAEGHASIRGLVATPGSSADAALLSFEKAVDRRIARLRTLNSQIEQRAAATVWSQPLQGSIDVQRIDEERRAYVSAGETAPTVGVEESPKALRLLDLHARKLIVTVATMRDSAEMARGQALFAAEEIAAVSSGFGSLLIAYLIWYPIFTRRREPAMR